MKINKEKLKEALEIVKPGLENKGSGAQFSLQRGWVDQMTSFAFIHGRVVTFNDEISISHPVKDLQLTGAIHAEELYKLLAKSNADELQMAMQDDKVVLKAGRSKAQFSLQQEITLPLDELGDVEEWHALPSNFADALMFCAASCATDMSSPAFTCVSVQGKQMYGTDSYRIATYMMEDEALDCLIPHTAAADICKINPIEIASTEGWLHFRNEEGTVLSCRQFNAEFPNMERFFAQEKSKTPVHFPDNIINLLGRACIFAERDHKTDERVVVTFAKGKITLHSSNEHGSIVEKDRCDYKGAETLEFMITPYLLRDILRETKTFHKTTDTDALLFTGENWKYLSVLRQG